jgi:hypothetical protein
MLDTMTLREFAWWEAMDRVEPIGVTGIIKALSMVGSIASGVAIPPDKFTPWAQSDDPAKPLTAAQIQAAMQASMGGR